MPWSGSVKPEIRSNSVVLPAPLWPMSPTIWPAPTSRSTSSTATIPPKRRCRPGHRQRRDRARKRLDELGAGPRAGAGGDAREEHGVEHVGTVEQVGGRAGEADLALLEEHGPLGDGQGDVDRLLDDDHGDAGGHLGADHLEEHGDDRRRQAERELVDEEQARSAEERLGQRQHLLLAAGQGAGRLVEPRRAAPGTGRAPPRAAPRSVSASRRNAHAATRRFSSTVRPGNTPRPPGTMAMPSRAIASGDRPSMRSPSNHTSPPGRREQPGDRPQHARLARAVGAEQGDDLAVAHGQVDAEQHLERAVGRLGADALEQTGIPGDARRGRRRRRRPRRRRAPRGAAPPPTAGAGGRRPGRGGADRPRPARRARPAAAGACRCR